MHEWFHDSEEERKTFFRLQRNNHQKSGPAWTARIRAFRAGPAHSARNAFCQAHHQGVLSRRNQNQTFTLTSTVHSLTPAVRSSLHSPLFVALAQKQFFFWKKSKEKNRFFFSGNPKGLGAYHKSRLITFSPEWAQTRFWPARPGPARTFHGPVRKARVRPGTPGVLLRRSDGCFFSSLFFLSVGAWFIIPQKKNTWLNMLLSRLFVFP